MAPTSRVIKDIATVDLCMEPFDRVCGNILGGAWGSHVGEDVVLGFVHENASLGALGLSWSATLGLRAVGVLLGEGGGDEGGDDAPALAAGMGQQVAGEVHALPGGGGSGSRRPSVPVVVGDQQLHTTHARAGPASANSVAASDAPIAMPRTSRGPGRPTATVTATETMRPVSRTFT